MWLSPRTLLSAGFSTANSVPASCAALSRTQRRSTILLAVLSSFSCPLGGGCRPAGNLRVRTGGGPGFFSSGVGKWRAMENVLHGGAAKMAK